MKGHFKHKGTGYILRLSPAHDSFHLAEEYVPSANRYMKSHFVSKGSMASFLDQHERIIVITCESCHADYEESETKLVESQGEIFCISCYEEWEKHYSENKF
jgi:predicted CXXCH cytochrome family protein